MSPVTSSPMFKDTATRLFLVHLLAYIVVVGMLAALNLWLGQQRLWFVWVLLGWGIGVATHGLALYLRKTHRRERVFSDRKTRGFTVHAFAYAAVILLLLYINMTRTPQAWWSVWVALGWGAGLAFHAWCAFGKRRRHTQAQQSSAGEASKSQAKKPTRSKGTSRRKKS